MNKRMYIYSIIGVFLFVLISSVVIHSFKKDGKKETDRIEATVMSISNDKVSVQDRNNIIYTFDSKNLDSNVGDKVVIEYTGLIDKNKDLQTSKVVSYTNSTSEVDENGVPKAWLDDGIFSQYYILANNKLKEMTMDEKISQLLLVRYPDKDEITDLKKYQFGGYLFFEKDFKNKTLREVQERSKALQEVSKIPILTAVDEEGGKVVRVSSNPNLSDERFKSSQELYEDGGFDAVKEDTLKKSKVLKNLGLNLNLAPVVDVSTDPSDYMYERSFGKNTELTSEYAKTVIDASKNTGVSYTLKHFPGYGNNDDTHDGMSIDNRPYDDILRNDLPPFRAGIDNGAEAVLVSHNVVTNIDADNPASLSASVHNLLRNELDFTGIIITDDLAMGAIDSIDKPAVKALLAGNDIIITTNYVKSINDIKNALADGTISEELVDKLAFRVIAWKYYKGLLFEHK